MTAQSNLTDAIKEFRLRLKLSQQAFANKLGVSLRAISNYERGRLPATEVLLKLVALADECGFPDLAERFTGRRSIQFMPLTAFDDDQDSGERQARHERRFPLAKQGPEEREYRQVQRVPFWFTALVLAVCVTGIVGLLWLVGRIEGTDAAMAGAVCIIALTGVLTFAYIAATEDPKQGE